MIGDVDRTFGRRSVALLAAAVTAAALCLGALAGTAGASKAKSVKTTVKIYSGNSERFNGRVTTGKTKACMKARKVTLYVNSASAGQRALASGYPGYEVVGTAKTKANGIWLVRSRAEPFLAGLYRAYVAPKTVTSGGKMFRCLAVWGKPLNA